MAELNTQINYIEDLLQSDLTAELETLGKLLNRFKKLSEIRKSSSLQSKTAESQSYDSIRLARLEQKSADTKQFARTLIQDSIDEEQILKWTNISLSELKEIKEELNKPVFTGRLQLKY